MKSWKKVASQIASSRQSAAALHLQQQRDKHFIACYLRIYSGERFCPSGKQRHPGASVQFPKNGWYAAIWSKDLTNAPVARTFLGEPVVLFRGANGKPAALEDRCCHRAAPLSRGEVAGENLRCGYHGLIFDAAGRCVEVPGQPTVPSDARVRAYPVAERWNVVWIWMGDPARADETRIVELPWLIDPGWSATPGYLRIDAMRSYSSTICSITPMSPTCTAPPFPAIRAKPRRQPKPSG